MVSFYDNLKVGITILFIYLSFLIELLEVKINCKDEVD